MIADWLASSWTRIVVLVPLLLSGVSGGCIVTQDKLDKELESLTRRLSTGNQKGLETLTKQHAEVLRRLDDAEGRVKALEVSLATLKTDVLALKGNISRLYQAAEDIGKTRKAAEDALKSAAELRQASARTAAESGRMVQAALAKYRALLLEEKRLLAERLRFLNEALREVDRKAGERK